jgi:signal transduction histidine kinase
MDNDRLENQDREQLLVTARRLLVEAEALSSRIAAVNEIGIAINRTFELDEILRVVAKQSKWLLDFEHCSVCLRNRDGSWRLAVLFGHAVDYSSAELLASDTIGPVLTSSQSRLIRNGSASPVLNAFASQIILPLVAEAQVMGTINFAAKAPETYTQEDLRIAYMLGLQLASAIRNAEHVQELRRVENELRGYTTELEATNQELDAYSHTIAHDLKTPLSSIVLKTHLLERTSGPNLPPKAQNYLGEIKTSALKMATMIDQLLWLAKLRDPADSVERVEMFPVIVDAVDRHKHTIDLRKIKVEVVRDMLPPVLGHAQWVEEVLANLIGNAVKYMGDDNPAPRIAVRGIRQDGWVRYEVQDNGVGISAENQTRLFTMFTRLHTVNTEGLGLGLSIVHRIVTTLNGQVGIESEPGKGSTFWFTLPTAEV